MWRFQYGKEEFFKESVERVATANLRHYSKAACAARTSVIAIEAR
jgi:hypothetical protein